MIVLDCSAAVEIVRGIARGRAYRLLMMEGELVIASDLLRVEARNAFWRYVQAKMMSVGEAEVLIGKVLGLVDEFVPLEENAAESFAEAVRWGIRCMSYAMRRSPAATRPF